MKARSLPPQRLSDSMPYNYIHTWRTIRTDDATHHLHPTNTSTWHCPRRPNLPHLLTLYHCWCKPNRVGCNHTRHTYSRELCYNTLPVLCTAAKPREYIISQSCTTQYRGVLPITAAQPNTEVYYLSQLHNPIQGALPHKVAQPNTEVYYLSQLHNPIQRAVLYIQHITSHSCTTKYWVKLNCITY